MDERFCMSIWVRKGTHRNCKAVEYKSYDQRWEASLQVISWEASEISSQIIKVLHPNGELYYFNIVQREIALGLNLRISTWLSVFMVLKDTIPADGG